MRCDDVLVQTPNAVHRDIHVNEYAFIQPVRVVGLDPNGIATVAKPHDSCVGMSSEEQTGQDAVNISVDDDRGIISQKRIDVRSAFHGTFSRQVLRGQP